MVDLNELRRLIEKTPKELGWGYHAKALADLAEDAAGELALARAYIEALENALETPLSVEKRDERFEELGRCEDAYHACLEGKEKKP